MEKSVREIVQNLLNLGISNIKKLMKAAGTSKSTIMRIKRKIKSGQSIERKARNDSRSVLKTEDHYRISALSTKHPKWSNKRIAKRAALLGSPLVTRWTIGRYLISNNWDRWTPAPIPILTPAQKNIRVAWCKKHINRRWNKVIFSDESSFQFFRHKIKLLGKERVKRMVPKHSPSVMVWGAMSIRGVTALKFVTGTINSERYCSILNDFLLKTGQALYPDGYFFVQDNAPCHKSTYSMKWLKENKVRVIEWPAASPDLNPIENLWQIIKRKVEDQEPKTIIDWKNSIEKIWDETSHDLLNNLIKSMPRRCQMCIDANGDTIKY